jgi:hypothetical protein
MMEQGASGEAEDCTAGRIHQRAGHCQRGHAVPPAGGGGHNVRQRGAPAHPGLLPRHAASDHARRSPRGRPQSVLLGGPGSLPAAPCCLKPAGEAPPVPLGGPGSLPAVAPRRNRTRDHQHGMVVRTLPKRTSTCSGPRLRYVLYMKRSECLVCEPLGTACRAISLDLISVTQHNTCSPVLPEAPAGEAPAGPTAPTTKACGCL